jgi:hypothetical protein
MNIDMLVATMRTSLASIESKCGAILFSSGTTLKPGIFYLLGLNPGGEEGPTIGESLDHLHDYKCNAYLDEDWSTEDRHYAIGGHPLQRHVAALFKALVQDLRDVCAANLIFTRSVNQNGAGYRQNANLCWPVHREIIRIVKPSVILAFGNGAVSPFSYIRDLDARTHGCCSVEGSSIPARFHNWECKAFRTDIDGHPILVVGLPHLSRYNPVKHPEVIKWIQDLIAQ